MATDSSPAGDEHATKLVGDQGSNVAGHTLSRRRFLGAMLAGSGITLLAACSQAPAAPSTSGATNAPGGAATTDPSASNESATLVADTEGQAKIGGLYRMLGTSEISTLDPIKAGNWEDWWSVGTLLFSQLYSYNSDLKLVPSIAADMPKISSDRLSYTFPLRSGVLFHNGRAVTSEDLKFSLERAASSSGLGQGLNNILGFEDIIAGKTTELAGVKVVDEASIEVTLKQPQATFLYELANAVSSIVPKQEVIDAGNDWGTNTIIGTGPFKFKDWIVGEKVTYERNAEYFGADKPNLGEIELYINVQPSVALLRWESQDAEYTPSAPASELLRILADDSLKNRVRRSKTTIIRQVNINIDAKPFDDVRVRQAVAHAIDKAALVKKAGNGGILEGFISPLFPQFDPNFKSAHQYDPEKSRALLAEAGFPDGISGISAFVDDPDIAPLIQADLKAVGIDVEVYGGDYAPYEERWDSGEMPIQVTGFGTAYPDAYGAVIFRKCPNVAAGEVRKPGSWCSAAGDELVAKAELLDIDDPERTRLYQEIQKIWDGEAAFIPLYYVEGIGLSQEYIVGDSIHPIYGLPILATAYSTKA